MCGLNQRWRVYRYNANDTFKAHKDAGHHGDGVGSNGEHIADMHKGKRISVLTFLMYLNDDCEGGSTRCYFPPRALKGEQWRRLHLPQTPSTSAGTCAGADAAIPVTHASVNAEATATGHTADLGSKGTRTGGVDGYCGAGSSDEGSNTNTNTNSVTDTGPATCALPVELHTNPRVPLTAVNVVPKRGSVLCFWHGCHRSSTLHEGSLVSKGTKYVVRTDVLYARQDS